MSQMQKAWAEELKVRIKEGTLKEVALNELDAKMIIKIIEDEAAGKIKR